jgi:hypothetical protein
LHLKIGTRSFGQCSIIARIAKTQDVRSVRIRAVKPRAFGARYAALGLDRSSRSSIRSAEPVGFKGTLIDAAISVHFRLRSPLSSA